MTRLPWTLTLVLLSALLLAVGVAHGQDRSGWRETDWSAHIAAEMRASGIEAVTEFRTPDGSRVDILTPEYAYEVEWVSKQWQSTGQATYYGLATNRKPGVILLMKGEPGDELSYARCLAVCAKLGIRLETRLAK